MALRISHVVYVSLWLSLLLLLFHQLYNSKSKPTITKQQTGIPDNNIYSSSSSSFSRQALVNRKVLSRKFDFTPFQKKSRQTHHGRGSPDQNVPPESEIDPRYGVQKRLVPTGPNPLHH